MSMTYVSPEKQFRKDNITNRGVSLSIAQVMAVYADTSTMDLEVFISADGNYGFYEAIPFSSSAFDLAGGGGLIYTPVIGSALVLAHIGVDVFPLAFIPLPYDDIPDDEETADDGRFRKRKTFDGSEGNSGKRPNYSCGRRSLPSGGIGMFFPGGKAGVMIQNGRSVRVFAAEDCKREYVGDDEKGKTPPEIQDFTTNYVLESLAYQILSKKREGKSKKCMVEHNFFSNSKQKAEKYFQIKSGDIKENKDYIRVEALREPEKDSKGAGIPSTKKVPNNEGAGDQTISQDSPSGETSTGGSSDSIQDDSKGRSHKSLYKEVVKKDGSVVAATKEKFEWQSEKDILFFMEKLFGAYGKENGNLFFDKILELIGKEKLLLSSSSVTIEVKDKVNIRSSGNSSGSNLPNQDDMVL